MRTLSSVLQTAQASLNYSRPLWKLVLSRAGETTVGYDNTRIKSISHPETPDSQKAEVLLRNYDGAITSLDFETYQGVISYGINTGTARSAWVANTAYAIDDVVIPTTATGYQYRCSIAGTSHATTEPTWPTALGTTVAESGGPTWEMDGNSGDEYSRTAPLKCVVQNFQSARGQKTCTLSLIGIPDQMAQDGAKVKYTQLPADTNTVQTLITAIATAGAGLGGAFNGYTAITVVYDGTDSLLTTFVPADFFSINVNETRWAKIQELLAYTTCKIRVEKDGNLHVYVPTASGTGYNYEYDLTTALEAIMESYTTGDDDWDEVHGALWSAQTFTPVTSHRIKSVKLRVYGQNGTGSPGNLTISIRATDVNGHPTGSDLCSGIVDASFWGSSVAWREITLGNGYYLVAGTKYAIVCRALTGDSDNWVAWRKDSSSPTYTGGNREVSANSGVTWSTSSGVDFMFEEWRLGATHLFFNKGLRKRFISPNEEIVKSHPDHIPQYSGSATSATSYALLPKTHTTYRRLTSDAQAASLAAAMINKNELDEEKGLGIVPMNVGQEIWDYVKVTDSRENDSQTGNIQFLQRNVAVHDSNAPLTFTTTFSMGKLSAQSLNLPSISEIAPTLSNDTILKYLNQISDYVQQLGETVYTKGLYYVSPRVFTTTPTPPYDVGDLWLDDTVVKRCTTAKDSTGSYVAGDWTQLTVDELASGAYGTVLISELSAGHLKLTANALFEGKWYNQRGVSIDASTTGTSPGINIWSASTAFYGLTTRASETSAVQCYVGTNGELKAGGGAVYMNELGLNIYRASTAASNSSQFRAIYGANVVGEIYPAAAVMVLYGLTDLELGTAATGGIAIYAGGLASPVSNELLLKAVAKATLHGESTVHIGSGSALVGAPNSGDVWIDSYDDVFIYVGPAGSTYIEKLATAVADASTIKVAESTYQNTTGYPLIDTVTVSLGPNSTGGGWVGASTASYINVAGATNGAVVGNMVIPMTFVVPVGYYYKVTQVAGTVIVVLWSENTIGG